MQIFPLYRYNRPNGGMTVSPIKPNCQYIETFRIIADEGMELTDGIVFVTCIDTDDISKWQEVSEQSEIELRAQAYDIITGVVE